MKKSITYRFVLRADERPINEKVSIYLSLYIPSFPARRIKIPNVKINPKNWIKENWKVNKKEPHYNEINLLINNYDLKAQKIILEYSQEGKMLTYEKFNKEFLFDGFEKKFVDFCFEILDTEYNNPETIRGYKNHLNKLNQYAPDLRISELSEEFFIRYENDLLKRGNSYNTAKRNLKTFNKMINLAIRKGLLKENPLKYISLNPKKLEVDKYLELEEFKSLYQYYLKNESTLPKPQRETLRAFCFSVFAQGIRPNDIRLLKYKNLRGDKLVFTEHKTQNARNFNLIPIALDLLKYEKCFSENQNLFTLPVPQVTNRHLKYFAQEINKKAKRRVIREDLTFYFCRRTFVTIFQEATGDIFLTSKTVGHSNVKTTEAHYAGVSDKRIDDGMKRFELFLKNE
ncbi:MAG TPA: site-specific integrase [Bacteroidales bacterium]|nr:site-specific integrase [Candidatus Paceibacterota bacterium]HPS70902.1 site-specific integrase [Bacteroidales bacterium]